MATPAIYTIRDIRIADRTVHPQTETASPCPDSTPNSAKMYKYTTGERDSPQQPPPNHAWRRDPRPTKRRGGGMCARPRPTSAPICLRQGGEPARPERARARQAREAQPRSRVELPAGLLLPSAPRVHPRNVCSGESCVGSSPAGACRGAPGGPRNRAIAASSARLRHQLRACSPQPIPDGIYPCAAEAPSHGASAWMWVVSRPEPSCRRANSR